MDDEHDQCPRCAEDECRIEALLADIKKAVTREQLDAKLATILGYDPCELRDGPPG